MSDEQRPARRRRARRPAGPTGDASVEAAGVFVVPTDGSGPDATATSSTPATEESTPATTSSAQATAESGSSSDDVARPVAAPEKRPAEARASRRVPRRVVRWSAAVAAVLIVIAGVAVSALFAVRTDDIRTHEARCAQYSGFARQMIVNLTSLSPDNIDQAIATFQRSTSGRALADVQQTMENTAGLIKQDKVTTRGTVLSDAVSACDADSGSVLVVSGWQLRNPAATQDVVQTFRWRVDVTDINGALKATKIQWVT